MTGVGAVVREWKDWGSPSEWVTEHNALARAYLDLANFSEGLECNVDALIQRCQEADATIRQQARERDKFAFDRQQLWAALKAAEARTADLLKALDGLLSPDKMSVYGTMDKIAAAWAAIAAAKGGPLGCKSMTASNQTIAAPPEMTKAELADRLTEWAVDRDEIWGCEDVGSYLIREAARRLSAPAGDDGWKAVVAKWRSDYDAAELRAINALEALQLAKTCLLVTPGVPQIVIDRVNEALLSAPASAAPRVGDDVRVRIIEMIRHDYEPPELIADAIIDLFAALSAPPAASADESIVAIAKEQIARHKNAKVRPIVYRAKGATEPCRCEHCRIARAYLETAPVKS